MQPKILNIAYYNPYSIYQLIKNWKKGEERIKPNYFQGISASKINTQAQMKPKFKAVIKQAILESWTYKALNWLWVSAHNTYYIQDKPKAKHKVKSKTYTKDVKVQINKSGGR